MNNKELFRVVRSSDYPDNIYIPLELSRPCKMFSLYNAGSDEIRVTVKGITIPIPALCSSGEVKFEKDWFSQIIIDAGVGHNFILELYRD